MLSPPRRGDNAEKCRENLGESLRLGGENFFRHYLYFTIEISNLCFEFLILHF